MRAGLVGPARNTKPAVVHGRFSRKESGELFDLVEAELDRCVTPED